MYMCMIVHANMLCARERVKQVKVDSRQWGVCYGKYACCVGYECWPCFGHICEKGRLSWLFPHGDQNITPFCSNAHRGLLLLHVQGWHMLVKLHQQTHPKATKIRETFRGWALNRVMCCTWFFNKLIENPGNSWRVTQMIWQKSPVI